MRILVILFIAYCPFIYAHDFHVGLAKAAYNNEAKSIEVSLEVEAHDIEDWLNDKGLTTGHIENLSSDTALQQKVYAEILKNFGAKIDGKALSFKIVGIEVQSDDRAYIYIIAENIEPFKEIDWNFSVLMDHDENQQNKLELTVDSKKYYATFLHHQRWATIKLKA